jgi:hypothetical protein
MQIHQIALHYQAEDDRLLLRVNTADAQAMSVWLTRRLSLRLWPHLSSMVEQAGVRHALSQTGAGRPSADAALMPQAKSMLAESARRQVLSQTDFSKAFDAHAAAQPLGAEPLLATAVHLTPDASGSLTLVIRDAKSRNVQMVLTAQMALAVSELMRTALSKADWGFAFETAARTDEGADKPRVLN